MSNINNSMQYDMNGNLDQTSCTNYDGKDLSYKFEPNCGGGGGKGTLLIPEVSRGMKTETRFFERIRPTVKDLENFVYDKRLPWMTEQPTKPGYYWAYEKKEFNIEIIKLDKFYLEDCPGECMTMDSDCGIYLNEFTHFMGPLEVPGVPS